jgi:regulator of sirC expression with transglutaminase-like and TPR domain
VHNVSDVREIEVHTAEPLVPGPSRFEVEITTKLKKYKSPGSDEIPAELIQAEDEILLSAIHKLINSVCNKEEQPDQWKSLLLYQFTKRVTKLTVIIIVGYHCYQLHTQFY